MRRNHYKFLHIFLIFAFIFSGISPACAFISGKNSIDIEICTADGLKTVSLPSDNPAPEKENHHEKKNDCGFCFARTHLKSTQTAPAILPAPSAFARTGIFSLSSVLAERFELASLSARAPPVSI